MSLLSSVSNQNLVARVQQLEVELEAKNAKNRNLEMENSDLNRRIGDITSRCLIAEERVEELEVENAQLDEDLTKSQQTIDNLNQEIDEVKCQQMIAKQEYQEEVDHVRQKYEQALKEAIKEEKRIYDSVVQQLNIKNANDIGQLEPQIKKLEKEKEAFEKEIKGYKKDIINLSKDQLILKNNFLKRRNVNLEKNYKELQAKFAIANKNSGDAQNFSFVLGNLTGFFGSVIGGLLIFLRMR